MDVQIFGLIIASVAMICGTVILVSWIVAREQRVYAALQSDKKRRQDAWDKTFNNEAMLLYETYREKCETLQVQNGILKQQLQNARELLGKVKVADLDGTKD